MLSPSVAALTSVTGSQSSAERRQRVGLQVGAERDADDRLRGDEAPARQLRPACGRASAAASPTTSAANSVGDGKPTALEREREPRRGGAEYEPWRRRPHFG